MKSQRKSLFYSLLVLSSVVVGVGVMISYQAHSSAPVHAVEGSTTLHSPQSEKSLVGTEKKAGNPAPRFALPQLEASEKAAAVALASEKEGVATREERDRFFAEERRIMAKTWGLSPEVEADFEIAVREAFIDRQAVFARLSKGDITVMEVGDQLRQAVEKARKRLTEIIGASRLLEYEITNGHFVEAGLDRKPFVPPTILTVPPKGGEDPATLQAMGKPVVSM